MKTLIRLVIAVMNLPRRVPALTKFVDFVIKSMTGNAWFPNPVPSLADVAAANGDLDRAETAAHSRTKGTADVRDEKQRIVRLLVKQLVAYVQAIADAHPEQARDIIHGSGFPMKKDSGHSKPDFAVKQGKQSGEVILTVKRAAKRSFYEWQYSTDQKVWTTLPSTLQVKTVVRGLTPATLYYFRFRAVTRAGEGDWSQVIGFVVS